MPKNQVDPASLEGEALLRWYRRTPQEIEQERRSAAAEAYNRFFYPAQPGQPPSSDDPMPGEEDSLENGVTLPSGGNTGQADVWPGYGAGPWLAPPPVWSFSFSPALGPSLPGSWASFSSPGGQASGVRGPAVDDDGQSGSKLDYGATANIDQPVQDTAAPGRSNPTYPSDDALWIATGSGGYRPVRSGSSGSETSFEAPPDQPNDLPPNPASPEDADFIEVGNPYNRQLRRAWEKANGRPWPKTADGRNYHVAHKRAIADGGTNTLDNIEPMDPDEHMALHINNGDNVRWGRRPWTARTFGGTVEPPNPGGLATRSLGLFSIVPAITGLLSGRIRTDTWLHTMYDLAGLPAPDDEAKFIDPRCRAMGVNTPGSKCA